MKTQVQARLVMVRVRQDNVPVTLLCIASRTTHTRTVQDASGVSIQLVANLDRLIPVGVAQ